MPQDVLHGFLFVASLGLLAALGLVVRKSPGQWWPVTAQKKGGLSLNGRLGLSSQSAAYLLDVEGIKILVVISGASISTQRVSAQAVQDSFRQTLEEASR